MTDKENLEMAAKVAGIDLGAWNEELSTFMYGNRNGIPGKMYWNPLTDDGDALRLAVKLEIDIDFVSHHAPGQIVVFTDGNWSEFCDPDPYAATRRAIVRAAAEIGKTVGA